MQPYDEDEEKDEVFFIFPSNGAPVELNWHGKTEVLGEKPVPVPLCPPQIPHGLTWDQTGASAVGGRRLTAWAMARPICCNYFFKKVCSAGMNAECHVYQKTEEGGTYSIRVETAALCNLNGQLSDYTVYIL
jgi:hypothetical protein